MSTTASETPSPEDFFARKARLENESLALIGQFVTIWNMTEHSLYDVLLKYAGVSDGVGRAIFSGARTKVMIDFLRSINTNTSNIVPARFAHLEFLMTQIGHLLFERDSLIHQVTMNAMMPASDDFARQLSNQRRVNRIARQFTRYIANTDLKAMIDDANFIGWNLGLHLRDDERPFSKPIQRTWLFRPTQLAAANSRNTSPEAR